ncbi:MAG: dehydrogenase [Anaerolineae bacterium]|nr:MAG: dehydrogenase [Anaerolineae bacterium]
MLRRMHLIRAFEERMAQAFAAGQLPAEALHLSIGQEACAVGACFALREGDYMTTTHRGHGHMLARGADLNAMTAELLGKATGLCKGLGGTMHVTDASIGALGANGIVGASSLIAVGAALSARQRHTSQVALAFMGDGATAQGMFHEALNFAAVFDLPVLFFVENNQYAEFTPLKGHTRLKRLADRALGHGLPGITIDGNDVWEVYQKVGEAAERARRGEGATLIEAITYRWRGHTEGETANYRSEEEIAAWKKKDPIARWERRLQEEGLLTAEECAAIAEEASRAVERAMEFALSSPEPEPDLMVSSLYAPEPAALYQPPKQPPKGERVVSVSAALWEALAEEMARDERVYVIGEDVRAGGYFAVTAGLVEEFGPHRIIDTPISEYAIVGSSVGAAMTGMRPVAEIEFSDFITCAMDPLVNQAAKLRFMSGGQYRLPLVVRTPGGGGIGMAAQHSQSLEAWLMHIPGLIILAPGTAYDAKGLLKAAIRSNNPVLFFENKLLYADSGLIPEGEYIVPIGVADVKRSGEDVTLVAVGAMVPLALEAAQHLEEEGISAEVVDVRSLVPCDWNTILRSVLKTRRLVVVEGGALTGGFGAECVARVGGAVWHELKAPPQRVAAWDVPIPYNRSLENAVVPDLSRLLEAVREIVR